MSKITKIVAGQTIVVEGGKLETGDSRYDVVRAGRSIGLVERYYHRGVGGVGARYRGERWGHWCWVARPTGRGKNGYGLPASRCVNSLTDAVGLVVRDAD